MTFKIISTTDNKYVGETIVFSGALSHGSVIKYKEVEFKIDAVIWVSRMMVQLVSSNYITVLKVVGV